MRSKVGEHGKIAARVVIAAVCLAVSLNGAALMVREMSVTRAFVAGLALLVFGVILGSLLIDGRGGLHVWSPTTRQKLRQ